ncbi:phosphate acyltransferase [Chromatiales bacterium (ex Bugula neritina AB1)]|nr:phosphate acyltransferase [Chromatiales bacterium (ex Bugula neritina AB1)]
MGEVITIALDAMSGDLGAETAVEAAISVTGKYTDLRILLVGDEAVLAPLLGGAGSGQIEIRHASEVVAMEDALALAVRMKKDSSMRVAINQVRDGEAAACVSCGNTAALVAIGRFVLKMLPGIDRPAIITAIPNIHGHVQMLDLGGNVDCSAEHLNQFAVMGAALSAVVDNIESPRVGLLNIGSEDIKGNELVKDTHALLEKSDLNYVGFIEGDEVYLGDVDVVVADGFVGNVALKTAEGVAKLISSYLKEEFTRSPLNKVMGLVASPVLKSLKNKIDPGQYNGASLLGLRGIVIKSHGGADAPALANALSIARIEAKKNLISLIENYTETKLIQTGA